MSSIARVQSRGQVTVPQEIRETCEPYGGSAGGHGSMAGARLPLTGRKAQRDTFKRELVRRFKEAFDVEGERGVSLLSDEA